MKPSNGQKNLKGLESVIFPSFTPDLKELDEENIRYDVNHLIANGFKSYWSPQKFEKFYVGRVKYAKGARLKKYS